MALESVLRAFKQHGFLTQYFETREPLLTYLKQSLVGQSIALGGSVTLDELGVYDLLTPHNSVMWHWKSQNPDDLHISRGAEVYITSANAASRTGELVNIDSRGNRTSMTLYGPERVIFIIGVNKLCQDLPTAYYRAKHTAAPKNAQRLKRSTPCAVLGDRCYDCNSRERLCNAIVVLQRPCENIKTEVLILNEFLGY